MNADSIAQFPYRVMHHISKLFTDSSGNVFLVQLAWRKQELQFRIPPTACMSIISHVATLVFEKECARLHFGS
jgi:hypothetical protein